MKAVLPLLLLVSNSALAQLALPVTALPRVSDVGFSVGRSFSFGSQDLFLGGAGGGAQPMELAAEVLFDVGSRRTFGALLRFEVALAYKYMWGLSPAFQPGMTLSGHAHTLPELSTYVTLDASLLRYFYVFAGAHLGIFSVSGVIRRAETDDLAAADATFSSQTLAPGLSLGVTTDVGFFLQVSAHHRTLPIITYGTGLSALPLSSASQTVTVTLGFQLDIGTKSDALAAAKTEREFIDEVVKRCAKPESSTCGYQAFDPNLHRDATEAEIEKEIGPLRDRDPELAQLVAAARAREVAARRSAPDPKPTEIRIVDKVIVDGLH